MPTGSAWAQVANTAFQMGFGAVTGNPVPIVTGAIGFAGSLYDSWQAAAENPSPSKRPTQPLSELIDAAIDRPGSSTATLPRLDLRSSSSPPGASSATRDAISGRAEEIARSPGAGSDFDNWLRAVVEVAIAQRAAEIARSPDAGSDFDNWLRAERELKTAQRAEEIARSPDAGSDFDNWLRAERELKIAQRAEEIVRSRPAGADMENWLEAEREIEAEQGLIAARARQIAASRPTGGDLDNWLQAERELSAADLIAAW